MDQDRNHHWPKNISGLPLTTKSIDCRLPHRFTGLLINPLLILIMYLFKHCRVQRLSHSKCTRKPASAPQNKANERAAIDT